MSKQIYSAILNIEAYRAWYEEHVPNGAFLFEADEPGKAFATVSVEGLRDGQASVKQENTGCGCGAVPVEYLFFIGGFTPADF